MGKGFTESEKVIIKDKLRKAAEDALVKTGIRKTSVDELVLKAGISKGAFYLFYETKELLFFEVIVTFHDKLQADFMEILRHSKVFDVDYLTDTIFNLLKRDQDFFVSILSNGEIEFLQRKLPIDIMDKHFKDDEIFFDEILSVLSIDRSRVKVFASSIRAIFILMLSKKMIGEDYFDDTIKYLLRGMNLQLIDS
ncbi:TetR/AcrR family transcriptional regulator [Bacteroides sp.]|jgi:Transcriptional regulator|uniref:TetR/AcrR family transcriptional regulator n=1 Tax=Bacteroides sp. TaxID=29523 RepID=UPI0026156699|nr:TetR/AcrR family transcriptional regulator [Bacteroides sp.]MDD3038024.1 TetR/AcrR family transcriptional regulator [Bacteroides sp.]